MSLEKQNDGSLALEGDHVETIILGLCCLEVLWKEHPGVVLAIAQEERLSIDILKHGPRARELLGLLTVMKGK